MITSIVTAFLASLAFNEPPRIESGTGDWSNIPLLSSRGLHHITSNQVDMLHEAFGSAECSAAQTHRKRLNLDVPFLVQFGGSGSLERVVVQNLECRPAEGVIAGAVLRLIHLGEQRATGENASGWYRGEIRLRSSSAIPAMSSGDDVICRQMMVTGSLAKRERFCYTRDRWREIAGGHRDLWAQILSER